MAKEEAFFKKHPWVLHVLLMVAVSIVLLVLIFWFIRIYARQGQEYELPDLVGQNIEQAKADNPILLDFVIMDSLFHPGEEGGRILSQIPKGGTLVKKGRKVYITMTAYTPEDAVLPELAGLTVRQAVSELIGCGLVVGKLKFVEDQYKNYVIDQSSKGKNLYAGQQIERGTVVDLTVGRGEGDARAIVPFTIGKTADRARRDILSASLNVGREHYSGVKNRATAIVYKQDPDYTGVAQYPYGSSVSLWFIDADQADADRLVKEYKVDSSKIIDPNFIDDGRPSPEEIEDNEDWSW